MSESGSSPGPTLIASAFAFRRSISGSAASPTATATAIAMQRWPAEPKPAAVRWLAAKSRSASGSTTAWFFAPPSACTRLPDALALPCTYCAIGVEPTKLTASMSGCSRIASTATLSPWTTLKTPSGRPASAYSSAMKFDADGSRSDGLSTNVLPVAIAIGCIHIGTITGKLNGVIPAQTPSGWRKRERVDAGGDLVGVLALEQLRDAARELGDLHAADDLALGVLDDLAVLGGDDPREVVEVLLDEVAEREHDPRAADDADLLPALERRARGGHRGVDVGPLGEQDLRLLGRRWRGRRPGRSGSTRPASRRRRCGAGWS